MCNFIVLFVIFISFDASYSIFISVLVILVLSSKTNRNWDALSTSWNKNVLFVYFILY